MPRHSWPEIRARARQQIAEYREGTSSLVDMLREDLGAECVAIETYRDNV